jgi:acyl-coenzyme A thioesterase PaaI-like protein
VTSPADLVSELRALIETVRTTDLDRAAAAGVSLDDLRARLADIRFDLAPHVVDDMRMQRGLYAHEHFTNPPSVDDLRRLSPAEFFPYSPVIGTLNPIAPDVHFRIEGDHVVGRGRVGAAHNGPPGSVHGGHVAALMDELLGTACVATGQGGFTGTLSIRYSSPTPLDTDLHLEGRVDRIEGRKIFAVGTLHAGDVLCASAEGIFIRPLVPPWERS